MPTPAGLDLVSTVLDRRQAPLGQIPSQSLPGLLASLANSSATKVSFSSVT
ncbi:MAG: hypothetical protein JWN03_4341 [Nocardia sp.]|nr:hypothetical protein [Nocardia sp.]